ncbi:MAG: formylglycine-generating enzyme family protein [Gammaproteobacteria bacterium]|nr:formylglycine-generating enzyme family protein [Gammaproteobacteria bacterium]
MTSLQSHTLDTSLPDVQSLSEEALLKLQREAAEQAGLKVEFRDRLEDGREAEPMMVIPPGLFEMGAGAGEFGYSPEEGPRHIVSIGYAFALGKTPVTAEAFARYMDDTGFRFRRDLLTARGQQPVINLRRDEAEDYARWLSQQTGQRYRLPTEAEWEYACRAGTSTAFSFGESVSCRQVHFNPAFPYEEARQKRKWYLPRCMPSTLPLDTGLLPPNRWGLQDMHGNVWEFTSNEWRDSHEGTPRDGSAGRAGRVKRIVVKGGSYFDSAIKSRSAARMPRVWDELDINLGVRLLREL